MARAIAATHRQWRTRRADGHVACREAELTGDRIRRPRANADAARVMNRDMKYFGRDIAGIIGRYDVQRVFAGCVVFAAQGPFAGRFARAFRAAFRGSTNFLAVHGEPDRCHTGAGVACCAVFGASFERDVLPVADFMSAGQPLEV